MTDEVETVPGPPPEGPPTRDGRPPRRWRPRRPRTPIGWVIAAVVALLLVGGLTIVGARYGVLAPQVRLLIEARTDGLKLGRFGRLKVEGLQGDLWRDFTVRRLTISDEGGVWLEANRLTVKWRYAQLFARKLDVDALTAEEVRVIRRPTLEPKGVSRGMPVSVQIDRADARIEMLPAFSGKRGVYDAVLQGLTVQRGGGTRLTFSAASVLHPGDFLKTHIDLGRKKELLVQADALEAQGGAIAGALGLSPDQPFSLQARANGTVSNGKLAMLAKSGALTPVRAQGAWSPAGGAVSANVLLSASRLTRFWETRLGPQAQLSIIGRQRPDKLYDFDIRAVADNLTLVSKGPIDLTKRRATGLQSTADVRELNKFFSIPKMQNARVVGLVTGEINDLSLSKAQVAVYNVVDGDYRLPVVSGPGTARFKDRQLDFQATVAGRGGGGLPGWQTVVLGPAPKASVTGTLFKDGRLLIRSIDASGKNMVMKGAGTRGIFGQQDFKGNLSILSLANERAGSGGSAKMSWVATQKDEKAPWNITLDGSGERFTLGYAEIDRLLGKTPSFKMQGAYLKQVFTVSKVTVDGASADIEAAGVRAPNGQLKFDGGFTAQGPFGVGPLEVTGVLRGKATITGTFEEPKTDLAADFESLALPSLTVHPGQVAMTFLKTADKVVAGGIAVTGATDYGPARAKSGFRLAPDGVDLKDIDADLGGVQVQGALSLRENTPSSADLTLAIGPGALLTSGKAGGTLRITGQPGAATAAIRLETGGAALRGTDVVFERGAFTADGPLARLPYKIDARGAWGRSPLVLDGGGQISEAAGVWGVTFAGSGQARTAKFQTAEPAVLRFGPDESSARMRVSLGGGTALVDARQAGETVDIKAALDGVDIGFLSEDFAGRFDADLTLQGRGDRLDGSLNAKLDNARSRDAGIALGMDGQVKAVLTDNRMNVDAAITSDQGLKASGNLAFTTVASAKPFRIAIARTQPMQGRFQADGEIQPLWDLLMGGERSIGGRVTTEATLAGTLNDPKITGHASMQNGKLDDYATGLRLRNMVIEADLQTDRVLVRQFSAADPQSGTLAGDGRVSLNRGGASDFTLSLKNFRLIDNDTGSANATGDVTVTRGADGRIKIVGALGIDRAEVNAAAKLQANVPTMAVVEINRPPALQGQLAAIDRSGPGVALDVRLTAPRRVLVVGRGLDLEMAVNARVTGNTNAPVLEGTASVLRGDYQFAGKRFEFDDTSKVQLSTNPALIRLDLTATRDDPALTAVIRIRGTAAKPEITLTSTPVLPNDEVLSQVLFGRSASQLSPLEAAQLASALTSLATGGGFDVIGGLRSLAGLDRLALAGGGQQAVSVAGGKYLTDNVYLELAGGGRDGPSAEVDYRVSRRLSIISRLSSQGGAKLAVRWRRDLRQAQPPRR